MKHTLIALALVLAFAGSAIAQDHQHGSKTTGTTELVCPVTGEKADPEVTFAYKGTTYYFCCAGCVTKFKNDPEKYIANSAKKEYDPCDHGEEGHEGHEGHSHEGHSHEGHSHDGTTESDAPAKAVINTGKDLSAKIVNTTCPVMKGEEVDKKVTTVTYKGKVYGFCCKGCIKKFAADPEKYLKKS